MYSVDGEIYSKQDMLDLVLSDKTKLYIFLEKPEVQGGEDYEKNSLGLSLIHIQMCIRDSNWNYC